MREHLIGLCTNNEPADLILFNACVFRRFGTWEFSERLGFITKWDPKKVETTARRALDRKERVFTGAYNVPNMGLSLPKEKVVVWNTLDPIWKARKELVEVARKTNSLEETHRAFLPFPSWGGSGFMAYEIVSDLRWTKVLCEAKDVLTWANPGVGARRGLNRLYGRLFDKGCSAEQCLSEMREIFPVLKDVWEAQGIEEWGHLEMREIEHSLCEFDKYERVRLGQGRPRSTFTPTIL